MANLSKIKREKMLDYLEKLKEINNDDENIRAITEIENALNEKKYGLVWEEHSEKVDEMLEHHIPIFVEDETRKIIANENETYNFLLEGDNLHSLKLLEKTHKGKIDVIYIDPPYNTGAKDWKYNNDFVDSNDNYRHSKWISFIKQRINIALELLSQKGFICISIDHYELAPLILLMDELLGEENRLGIITVVHKPEGRNQEKFFGTSNEFAVFYAKNKSKARFSNDLIFGEIDDFNLNDENGNYKLKNFIRMTDGKYALREAKPNFFYPIYVSHDLSEVSLEKKSGYTAVYPITKQGVQRTWKTLPKTFIKYFNDGNIEIVANGTDIDIYEKLRPQEVVRTHWIKKEYHAYHYGTKVLNNILGDKKFDFPKSVVLIKDIIKLLSGKKSNILDFFAGSGTTGHAVMQLNKEDGGNRKYILCTNNENNICEEVTYQRLKNIQEELPHNLKYYKTEFIPKFSNDEKSISEKMMEHIRELIELEYAIELDGKKYIILDDEDELDDAISKIENGGKLFVRSGVFLSRSNQRILEEKGVSIIEIPEYYFREELKEVGEL